MALLDGHRQNFETLRQAFLNGDAALMECELTATGEAVAVLCAANRSEDGDVEFVSFGTLFDDNPYTLVNPPNPEGGFYRQDEIWNEK